MLRKLTLESSIRMRPKGILTAVLTCLALFLTIHSTNAIATEFPLILIQSEDNEFYNDFSSSLVSSLTKHCQNNCANQQLSIDVKTSDQIINSLNSLKEYKLVITLGVKAQNQYKHLHSELSRQSVLHALVPKHLSHLDQEINHFSLVLDQQESNFITFVKLLPKTDKPVGLLYSDKTLWRISSFIKAASQADLPIKAFKVNTSKQTSIGESLKNILPKVSSIIMLPDKSLYNQVTINEILLTGYLSKVPFIGYSKALAKTGALASITTPTDSIISDITNTVSRIINGTQAESIIYPSTYKVILNQQISESLGLDVKQKIPESVPLEVIR